MICTDEYLSLFYVGKDYDGSYKVEAKYVRNKNDKII